MKKLGMRFNSGKVRLDLLPFGAISEVANVSTYGSRKYDDENWRKGLKFKDTYRAILSHAFKWFTGEQYDPESGCHHLAHAAWNCLAIVEFELLNRTELDDRLKRVAPIQDTKKIKEPPKRC
jgi:hypothetical protein